MSNSPPEHDPTELSELAIERVREDLLGRQLRQLYADVVEEGVPDRFASLLDQLDGSTGLATDTGGTTDES
ncbi:NepR family anti-sigma factor [Maricaulis maris]|uniref:Anti-sigma factor NepR domain-containing protein n=1 Tax=Maricaulis maris TaxID=74318 RepID=A0A495D1P3_9PROT|nr:NepR family anti-sigma factor [Maricaulis maris]RKQ95475.1 hypothetical protein C7435_2578 [Maricaulis maris]